MVFYTGVGALLLLVVAVSGEDPPWKDHGVICDTKECNFDCLCQKLAWVRTPLRRFYPAPTLLLPLPIHQPHSLDLIPCASIPPGYTHCLHRACQQMLPTNVTPDAAQRTHTRFVFMSASRFVCPILTLRHYTRHSTPRAPLHTKGHGLQPPAYRRVHRRDLLQVEEGQGHPRRQKMHRQVHRDGAAHRRGLRHRPVRVCVCVCDGV